MPYDTPFRTLSPPHHATLLDSRNAPSRRIYTDCLAMLHDVLVYFCSNPEPSVFEGFDQKIGKSRVEDHLRRLPPAISGSIVDIGFQNVEIAFDLAQQFSTPPFAICSHVARARYLADRYLDDLLAEYGAIR